GTGSGFTPCDGPSDMVNRARLSSVGGHANDCRTLPDERERLVRCWAIGHVETRNLKMTGSEILGRGKG
ncbi:MAG: hypothetical protein ACI9BK_003485, partial [Acidimicrobiales bacterium]